MNSNYYHNNKEFKIATLTGNGIRSIGKVFSKDSENILNKLIKDKSINKILNDRNLKVEEIHEIEYKNSNGCLGYNVNMGEKIGIVLSKQGLKFKYNTLISILLHEIAHCYIGKHNNNFKQLEEDLRKEYIKYGLQNSQVKVWDNYYFPYSNGPSMELHNQIIYHKKNDGHILNNKTNYFVTNFIIKLYLIINFILQHFRKFLTTGYSFNIS